MAAEFLRAMGEFLGEHGHMSAEEFAVLQREYGLTSEDLDALKKSPELDVVYKEGLELGQNKRTQITETE